MQGGGYGGGGAGGIPLTTVTAKGDLIAATAAGVVAPEHVGANGQVLMADSTQATGQKWATPAAAPVTSVAGRTGAIVLAEGDVTSLVADLAAKVAASLVTAKGDLLVATANATVARRAVGAPGTGLVADPTQADGVNWGPGLPSPIGPAGSELTVFAGGNVGVTADGTSAGSTLPPHSSAWPQIASGSDVGMPTGNPAGLSIVLWVETTKGTENGMLGYGSAGGAGGIAVESYAGAVRVINPSGAIASWAGTAPTDGTWHMLVVNYDGAHLRLVLDNVDKGLVTPSSALNISLYGLILGSDNLGNSSFAGSMARVAFFASALTLGQIASLWAAATAGGYDAQVLALMPVRYFKLTETSGRVAYDSSASGVNAIYNSAGLTYGVAGPITGASSSTLGYVNSSSPVTPFSAGVDQTASRAIGTTYVNGGGRRRTVHVTCTCAATVTDGATFGAHTTVGGTAFSRNDQAGAPAGVIVSVVASLTFEVDPGASYSVASAVGGASTVTLVHWDETDS